MIIICATNMADERGRGENDACFNVFTECIDYRIERILWQLEVEPIKDVAAELDYDFDIHELLDAREKLFERAVEKNKGRHDSPDNAGHKETNDEKDHQHTSRFIQNPWQLIKRRMSCLAAIDVCEIYRFLTGAEKNFPTRMLRRKPLATACEDLNKKAVILEPIVESEEKSLSSVDLSTNVGTDTGPDVDLAPELDIPLANDDMFPIAVPGGIPVNKQIAIKSSHANSPMPDRNAKCTEGPGTKEKVDLAGDFHSTPHVTVSKSKETRMRAPPTMDDLVNNGADRAPSNREDSREMFIPNGKTNASNPLCDMGSNLSQEKSPIAEADEVTKVAIPNSDRVNVNVRAESTGIERKKGLASTDNQIRSPEADQTETPMNTGTQNNKGYDYNMFSEMSYRSPTATAKDMYTDMHTDIANDIITQMFTDDTEMHNSPFGINNTPGYSNMIKSLEFLHEQPTLHIKSNSDANDMPKIPTLCIPTTTQKIPKRDGSLLDLSNSSQASFLREILEIHERLELGSAATESNKTPYIKKKLSRTMSTQTEPNVIPDTPIRRSKFECQVDYLERALTDHERRLRSFEVWQERVERRIEFIDSEYYNSYNGLKAAHDTLANETQVLREVVKGLLEKSKEKGCECPRCEARKLVIANISQQEQRADTTERETTGPPVKASKEPTRKSAKNEGERPTGTYDSFMKAAVKAVPSIAAQSETAGDHPPPGFSKGSDPNSARVLRRPRNRANQGRAAMVANGANESQPGGPTSTPNDKTLKPNISWVDIENEEDNVVDDYIASVIIHEGKCVNAKPQTTTSGTDTTKQGATGSAAAPGVNKRNPSTRVNMTQKPDPNTIRNGQPKQSMNLLTKPIPVDLSANTSTADKPPGFRTYSKMQQNTKPQSKSATTNATAKPAGPKVSDTDKTSGGATGSVWEADGEANGAEGEADNSYAKVVTKNGWNTVQPSKRKRVKSGTKNLPPLRGAQQRRTRDVYVRGLATAGFRGPEDLEEAMKIHCSERGVNANFARVMPNTYGSAIVGCRVNMDEEDFETLLDPLFWPSDVEVREWFPRGRERKPSRTFQSQRNDFE